MASITERRTDSGRSFVAQVRLKELDPVAKTFHARDYNESAKDARKAAEAWAAAEEKRLRALREQGGVRADVTTLTWAALVDEYLKDESTTRLSSYNGRHLQLCWWRKRYGSVRALEFASATRLRDAREHLRKEGAGDGALTAATTNRYLAAARACFNWARAAGLLPANVVWPPRVMVHEAHARDVYLTDEELTRAMDEAGKESAMWRAAVQFAVGVGLRQSEQLRVRWGDIDEVSQTVAVRVTKTATSRRVHLPPSVAAALRGLRSENVVPLPSAYVFADAAGAPFKQHVWVDAWHRIRKRAKLQHVRWHDLRHSCASFLGQNGASLLEISHQLGHLSVQTSKRYAHLVAGAKPTGADALDKKLGG